MITDTDGMGPAQITRRSPRDERLKFIKAQNNNPI